MFSWWIITPITLTTFFSRKERMVKVCGHHAQIIYMLSQCLSIYFIINYTSCDLNTTNHPVSSGWVSTCYVLVKEDLSLFLKKFHKSNYLKPSSVQISIISCKYVFTCLCVWLVTEIFICLLCATWKKISSVPPTARIQSFSKYVVFWPGEKNLFPFGDASRFRRVRKYEGHTIRANQ